MLSVSDTSSSGDQIQIFMTTFVWEHQVDFNRRKHGFNWEAPCGNPCRHWENMQAPTKRGDLNPSCRDVTVQPVLDDTTASESGFYQNKTAHNIFRLKHLNQVPFPLFQRYLFRNNDPFSTFCLFPYVFSFLCSQPRLTALSLPLSNHHHRASLLSVCACMREGLSSHYRWKK